MVTFIATLTPLLFVLTMIGAGRWQLSAKSAGEWGRFLFIPLGLLLVVLTLDLTVGYARTRFCEVWNYKITSMQYEEFWTTKESYQETYQSGTDSKGNATYSTRTVYYTQDHGPYWKAFDEYGDAHNSDQTTYEHWRATWGNTNLTGVNKGSAAGFRKAVSGNIYTTQWRGTRETIYAYADIRKYENRVRVSKSTFGFREADAATKKKYPRPADNGDVSVIHGYGVRVNLNEENSLRILNAELGRSNRVHNIVLLFDAGIYGADEILKVRDAWQGPNKNELVTCVGVGADGTVVWCDVMSWMDDTTIHGLIRQDVAAGGKWSADTLAESLRKNIPAHWEKKNFHAFDYLHIATPNWLWWVAMIVSIGASFIGVVVVEKFRG